MKTRLTAHFCSFELLTCTKGAQTPRLLKKAALTFCGFIGLTVLVPVASADTQVPITSFTKSNNIYTNLNQQYPNTGAGTPGSTVGTANSAFLYNPSTYTSANAVAGSNFANNGVSFLLASDASGHDFSELGTGNIPGAFTIPVNLNNVISFHTLMSAYFGGSVNVTFTGASGATETFSNISLPDFSGGAAINQSSAVNGSTTNNLFDQTVFRVQNVGAGGTGNSATGAFNTYNLVEQSYVLNAALAGQQLTSVTITSTGGTPLLLGITADVVPEPSTCLVLVFGACALAGIGLRISKQRRRPGTGAGC